MFKKSIIPQLREKENVLNTGQQWLFKSCLRHSKLESSPESSGLSQERVWSKVQTDEVQRMYPWAFGLSGCHWMPIPKVKGRCREKGGSREAGLPEGNNFELHKSNFSHFILTVKCLHYIWGFLGLQGQVISHNASWGFLKQFNTISSF